MSNGRQIRRKIQKEADKGNEPQDMALAANMADPEKKQSVSDAKIKQVEDITAMFMQLIHGEETRDSVMKTLKSNPDPGKAIPLTANMLMTRVETQTKKRRQKLPDDAKIAAAQYMVPDLAMLGNAAEVWDTQVSEEQLPQLLEDTMQIYIRQGIKRKSLDPVKLMRDAEKLMSPEQKAAGLKFGGEGMPTQPTPAMAVGQKVEEAVGKEQAKTDQAQAQVQALQGNRGAAAANRNEAQQAEQNAALTGPA